MSRDAPALSLFGETKVQLGPVHTEFTVAKMKIDGQDMVGLQCVTPVGASFFFLDSEAAAKLGASISSAAGSIITAPKLLADAPVGARIVGR